MKKLSSIVCFILAVCSAMVAYRVNVDAGSHWPLFWSCVDFFFWPLAWAKWLICHQVSFTLIKGVFGFLLA